MPERIKSCGLAGAVASTVLLVLLGSVPALAQEGTPPALTVTEPSDASTPAGSSENAGIVPVGSCFEQPAKIDEAEVKDFLDNPSALLAMTNPGLIPQVRGLAGSDAGTVASILEIAAVASPEQQLGFGTGLAQGALGCLRVRYDISRYIQQEVAKAGLENVLVAFMATAGEIETAALGSGGSEGAARGAAGIGAGGQVGGTDYEQEFPTAVNGPTAFLFNNGAFGFPGDSGSTFVVSPAEQ